MTLLQMSFAGTMMILLIALIRKISINKVPKNTFIVLWGIVLLRLLVPVAVPSALSIYSLFERPASETNPSPAQAYAAPLPELHSDNISSSGSAGISSDAPFSIWGIIYISGLIIISLVFIISYIKCVNEFKTALPVNNKYITKWLDAHKLRRAFSVRKSDIISSPLTFGIFRPVILIPKNIEWADESTLAFILEHELMHIKKYDSAKKLVLTAALCLHWFNPLVWLMYDLANRDIELSCDEGVICSLGGHVKLGYAKTLIKMEEEKSGVASAYSSFSKTAIEERIGAIMKTKTKKTFSIIISAAMLLLTAAVFAACSPADEAGSTEASSTETSSYGADNSSSSTGTTAEASGLSTQEPASESPPEANGSSASSSISLTEYKELAESQPSRRLTETTADDIYGSELSDKIPVPESAETASSLTLDGNTTASETILFSDGYKYFIVRIRNAGEFPINVDTDSIIYRIKPGDEMYIYSTRPSTSESHTVYFGTAVPGESMAGSVDFILSKEPTA